MKRKNTLFLSWEEVRQILFLGIDSGKYDIAVEDVNKIELVRHTEDGLTLAWDAPKPVRPRVTSAEQVETGSPCVLFNESTGHLLGQMGLLGVPPGWMERLMYCLGHLARATDRNGEVHLPAYLGHGMVGPYRNFDDFYQNLRTFLVERWEVTDTTTDTEHTCIICVALCIAANTYTLFEQFKDDFRANIGVILGVSCG